MGQLISTDRQIDSCRSPNPLYNGGAGRTPACNGRRLVSLSDTPKAGGLRPRDGTIKKELYQALKFDLLNGVFGMGERLNERQLSAKYGVSRAPLRHALALLQRDELVEAKPRVGYVTTSLTRQDVADIWEMRLLIEPVAAEKAATRISEDALRRLEQLRSPYQPGDRSSYRHHLDENLEFHAIIAEAAGNRRMHQLLTQMIEHTDRFYFLRLDLSTGDDVVGEHMQIAAALRRRDAALARELMTRHLLVGRQAAWEAIDRLTANRPL